MAESPRFSPSENQQQATHLHFQRSAPSAFLPPPRARDVRGSPPQPSAWGEARGGPSQSSQASTPTLASTARLEGVPWTNRSSAVGGFCEGLPPKRRTRVPQHLGLHYYRAVASPPRAPKAGAQPGVGGQPPGPDQLRGPLLLAPAPEGGEPGLLVPAGAPRLGCQVRASCAARTRRRGFRARGVRAGGGLERGRGGAGLPSPRPPLLPPSSRLRSAAATAPAAGGARNGAGLFASPRPAEASAGAPARDAPRPRGPRNGLRDQPAAPSAVPSGRSGPSWAAGPPPAPGVQRQPGKEGGRARRAATSRPPPGPARPAPAPARGSALNLKNKTRVWEGGARTAGGSGDARAAGGGVAASRC